MFLVALKTRSAALFQNCTSDQLEKLGQPFFAALILAQRACCAVLIFFLVAALIVRFLPGWAAGDAEPRIEASSFSNRAIFSLRSAARLSCADVNDNRLFMLARL